MSGTIDNTDDIIDSRDVIARFDELTAERESLAEDAAKAEAAYVAAKGTDSEDDLIVESGHAADALTEWDTENAHELKALSDFIDQGSREWPHGETLIRESYFKDYAQELAEDIGAIPSNVAWPCTCIDWDQATRELRYDYTGADFDGVTYYFRA